MKAAITLLGLSALLWAEAPKPLATDKAAEHAKLIIKLQAKQLEYFGTKEQIEAERKKFEKQAEEALQKKVSEFQEVQATYQKFVEEQRKAAGVSKECTLDEQGAWKCPEAKK